MSLPESIKNLRELISGMPSMSDKGAERFLEYWWNNRNKDGFGKAWSEFLELKPCKKCFFFAKLELCEFCTNEKRDKTKICVLSSPFATDLFEKQSTYDGLYFVLGGEVTGSKNFNRLELVKERVKLLGERVKREDIKEIILANDFTSQGEATALFIKENISGKDLRITRLSRGFGSGDMLAYSDPMTIKEAMENRR